MILKKKVSYVNEVELCNDEIQVLLNALSCYGHCCEDFLLVSPSEREMEYYALKSGIISLRDKILKL